MVSRDTPTLGRELPDVLPSVLLAFGALFLIFGTSSDASAQTSSKPTKLVVFKLEGSKSSEQLRADLTAVIREEVRNRDDYGLVNDNAVVLSDTVVVLGCNSVNTKCLKKAADHFGADQLVYGRVEKLRGRTRVSVRLFDSAKGRYVDSFGRVITEMSKPYQSFRQKLDGLLGPGGPKSETKLRVEANAEDATVLIDGEAAGRTPFLQTGLEPGSHDIRVEAEGYEPWSTTIDLKPRGTAQIRVSLTGRSSESKSPTATISQEKRTPGAPSKDRSKPGGPFASISKWGPWATIGVGALSLAGSGIAFGELKRAENDLTKWRQRNEDQTAECETQPECDIIERGKNSQTAHHILLGLGGVSVAGGITWLLLRTSGDDSESTRAAFTRRPRVVWTGKGLRAVWRW